MENRDGHSFPIVKTCLVGIVFCVLFASPLDAANLWLMEPTNNTIAQRDGDGKADLLFVVNSDAGQATVTLSRAGGEGGIIFQQILAKGETKGGFPRVPGGLYDLCVKPLDKLMEGSEDCRRVGVGEVFLVAGQSNAVSTDLSGHRHSSATGWVAVNDYHGDLEDLKPGDAIPLVDHMVFTGPGVAITANVCWMRLGDLLVEEYKVPVAFVNVARNGTNTDCWNPVGGECWPLFENVLSQRKYRAVLWHQGESDVMWGFSEEKSLDNMSRIIEASRRIAPGIPWLVAHNSLKNDTPYELQPIRLAQTAVVARGLACAGPDTDIIRENPEWVGVADFGKDGLTRHGELWFPIVGAFLEEGRCLSGFAEE